MSDAAWVHLPDTDLTVPPTPPERAVMSMLMERGHYQETPDDYEWLRWDARRAVEAAPDGYAAVCSAFLDTGLHGEQGVGTEADEACFDEDIRRVLEIVVWGGSIKENR